MSLRARRHALGAEGALVRAAAILADGASLGARRLEVVDAVSTLSPARLTDGLVGALDLPRTAESARAP